MLTNILFGCGFINLNEKKVKELKRTYELLIMRKLKLGDRFPRKLLFFLKLALLFGFVSPRTLIDFLLSKTLIGNRRNNANVELISVHEENF